MPDTTTIATAHMNSVADLVRRFNAVTHPGAKRTDGTRWDRHNIVRFLEACGVQPLPRKSPKSKLYYSERDLRETLPSFWEALLDAEHRLALAAQFSDAPAPAPLTIKIS